MQIVKIRHYGMPFVNSYCAKVLVTGIFHHYVLIW